MLLARRLETVCKSTPEKYSNKHATNGPIVYSRCGLPREAHKAKKVSSMRAKSFEVALPETPEKPQVCIKVARPETPDPRPGEMYSLSPPLEEHVMVPVAPLPPVGPESLRRAR